MDSYIDHDGSLKKIIIESELIDYATTVPMIKHVHNFPKRVDFPNAHGIGHNKRALSVFLYRFKIGNFFVQNIGGSIFV